MPCYFSPHGFYSYHSVWKGWPHHCSVMVKVLMLLLATSDTTLSGKNVGVWLLHSGDGSTGSLHGLQEYFGGGGASLVAWLG